ncbi:tRNA lysidine(34) synthetase TilS [Psychrobacter sp. CAM01]|uniref:tRNA lysidine(34) synthetase TilS n=1 Tax=Psychrobacter sp. CAM01 TaxID=3080335 RepID=UPI002935C083|nr:tRNA lysidine(34) synthetase TilS [Psychrobacter sp. CAM01]MDV2859506.1 tRNA lysidine(34) synthetase TilS [Psychrobacter sp. CAM01]
MTSSAIIPSPIKPIATLPIDADLAQALLSSLIEYGAQLHGRRVWLACSGGRDSLALAALCVQLYHHGRLPFLPQLLHVDHGLQADSSVWAQHIARWATAQNLPCQILRAQVKGQDEQAARHARYEVMRAVLNTDDVLLLAHHADDQAETILMRLIQGAGVNGLSGMQPWRTQTQGGRRNALWRPWLTAKRSTISRYAQRLQLPYIDDPTNEAGDNVRSGLRRDVMPVLATYNPNVIDNIARSAQLLSDAQSILNDQAIADLQRVAVSDLQLASAQRVLDIAALNTLPPYRQRQLLHHWLTQDEPLPPTKQLVDEVFDLSRRQDSNHQTALFWQAGLQSYVIRRYRQRLYRISSDWLDWLTLPLGKVEHVISDLTAEMASTPTIRPQPILMTLRSDTHFVWQAKIWPHALAALLGGDRRSSATFSKDTLSKDTLRNKLNHQGAMRLSFAPLARQQRVRTVSMPRPQAGKKLYQTLGIPVWLRESLVIVSVAVSHSKDGQDDLIENAAAVPILLLSPFDCWILHTGIMRVESNHSAVLDEVAEGIISQIMIQKSR